jgi:endoglucanase
MVRALLDARILSSRIAVSLGIVILTIYFKMPGQTAENDLKINALGYFESRGLNFLVFSNWYDGNFSDAKVSGVEIIHHGVRTATNGDVRLSPTPAQWDSIPHFVSRNVDSLANRIEVSLTYPSYNFAYRINAETNHKTIVISVILDKPIPRELEGRAGFNLEFLPSAYFEKSFVMEGRSGLFPLYPTGPMGKSSQGSIEPQPIASGSTLVLAPEDPERRITIKSSISTLQLFDGRNIAQNGWFVVRSLIPEGRSGKVVEWSIEANTIPQWRRRPVIAHSQLGYHPSQKKMALIELDQNDTARSTAHLLKVGENGEYVEKFASALKRWGRYLRFDYSLFDFTSITDSGLYVIEYGSVRTKPFRVASDIYQDAWHPTLDVYLPVQMDHVSVREAYRVWHGASHLDDALQAPTNHVHFDLYAQGPTTDSPFNPGEHIPGLNVGGWYDAGDYDIRTQTQCGVVLNLVRTWESFHPMRDETTVNEENRSVEIHRPDGIPDVIQQIEHGVLQLLGQQKAVGHAINGIIEAHLSQYTHLGDGSTATDNLVYNPRLDSLKSDGFSSGTFDDRWAFTSRLSPLNYNSAAALAAASRALHGYNDTLAQNCLATATQVWREEHSHTPDLFHNGNTTGGRLEGEEFSAAAELLVSTKSAQFAKRVGELLPAIENDFPFYASAAVQAIPFLDSSYSGKLAVLATRYQQSLVKLSGQNPFGVPISTGGWGGSGLVVGSGITNYVLYKAFPGIIDPSYTVRCLDYVYGCHPGSDISFVSGVGTVSKKIAYGNNRADFTFIAGGVVPGVLVLKPDFPENKEDWPFLWGENEYVVGLGARYIYLVNAVDNILHN